MHIGSTVPSNVSWSEVTSSFEQLLDLLVNFVDLGAFDVDVDTVSFLKGLGILRNGDQSVLQM